MMDTEEPIKVEVKEEPKDLKTEAIAPETVSDNSVEPMPEFASNYLPLVQYYNIEHLDQEQQSKLQTVWQHFAKDAKTPSTVLKKIRIEHMNLAQPNIGDTRLNQMYNYIRILQDLNEAKEMKEAFRK
jgi:hypothetical protein